jgi:hypothetical protein
LSACTEIRDYNVLLPFYPYLQNNPYLQDNDSCLLSNSILIRTSKKRMNLIETLLLVSGGTLALEILISVYAEKEEDD